MQGLEEIGEISGAGSAAQKQRVLYDLIQSYGIDMELVLRVAFDPFLVTHISKVEPHISIGIGTNISFDKLIQEISSVRALNNELRNKVNLFICSFAPFNLSEILGKVITKSLSIGISVKTINKVMGYKFINDLEIMKGEVETSIVQAWLDDEEDVFAEIKYDGVRCFAICEDDEVKRALTYSLTELDIEKMTHLVKELELILPYIKCKKVFFDFEITGIDRKSVGGEVNKLIQGTAEKGCDKNWRFNIFDLVPNSVFKGTETKSYIQRTRKLRNAIDNCKHENKLINSRYAKRWRISSFEQLNILFAKVIGEGEEGLMVKLGKSQYVLKRSKDWIKMKAVNTADLRIIGWYPGEKGTKREPYIGGFICESEDKKLMVDVGGGFSDKLLKEIEVNGRDSYISRIIEVLYNMKIEKKTGGKASLFLPRLSKKKDPLRFDKIKANYINELK